MMRILITETGSLPPSQIKVSSPLARIIVAVDRSRKKQGTFGGAAKASFQLYEHFTKTRHSVDFFADFSAFTKKKAVTKEHILNTDYDYIFMNSIRDVLVVDEYMKMHNNTKVIYTDRANVMLNLKDFTKIHPRMPAVFYLVTTMKRWLYAYVAITAEQEETAKNSFEKKTRVSYIPIAPDDIYKKMKIKSTGSALYVGRLDENQKRITFMINSMKLLVDEHKELRGKHLLKIVGDGIHIARYREQIEDAGLEKNVTLNGPAHGKELVKEYNNASFFVSTSLWESPGRTFLEAMACGLPLLINNSNNALLSLKPEQRMVSDGKNGLVYEFMDAGDFADKFCKFYCDKKLREKLAKGALEFIKGFRLDNTLTKYDSLIKQGKNIQ